MTTYTNTSEKYGDPVQVTINDYRDLNPDGKFEQDEKGIYEIVDGYRQQIAEPAFQNLAESIDGWDGLVSDYINGTVQVYANPDGGYTLTYNQNRVPSQSAMWNEEVSDIETLQDKMIELNPNPSEWHHIEAPE